MIIMGDEEPSSSNLKRKLPESPKHTSSSESTSPIKYLKKRESPSDSSSSIDRVSSIPLRTSQWTEEILNKLQITSDIGNLLSSAEIIEDHFLKSLGPFNYNTHGSNVISTSTEPLMDMIDKCMDKLDNILSPLKLLDINDIMEITPSLAYSLTFWNPDAEKYDYEPQNQRLHRKIRSWMPDPVLKHEDDAPIYLKWFYQKFYVHGHAFTQQLLNMCIRKGNEVLKDEMFESLFQEFAGMFGLMLLTRSQQTDSTFRIEDDEVVSKPDIIFPYFMESDEVNMKVLAICKVKSDDEERDIGSAKQTQSQKKKDMGKKQRKQHLDEKILGQHGGELLVHLPLTENSSLLGIIVQRTNVTFSHISCSEDQLEKLRLGLLPGKVEIKYSRPYNFLRAKDRKILTKAFLTLSAIQLTPYM